MALRSREAEPSTEEDARAAGGVNCIKKENNSSKAGSGFGFEFLRGLGAKIWLPS